MSMEADGAIIISDDDDRDVKPKIEDSDDVIIVGEVKKRSQTTTVLNQTQTDPCLSSTIHHLRQKSRGKYIYEDDSDANSGTKSPLVIKPRSLSMRRNTNGKAVFGYESDDDEDDTEGLDHVAPSALQSNPADRNNTPKSTGGKWAIKKKSPEPSLTTTLVRVDADNVKEKDEIPTDQWDARRKSATDTNYNSDIMNKFLNDLNANQQHGNNYPSRRNTETVDKSNEKRRLSTSSSISSLTSVYSSDESDFELSDASDDSRNVKFSRKKTVNLRLKANPGREATNSGGDFASTSQNDDAISCTSGTSENDGAVASTSGTSRSDGVVASTSGTSQAVRGKTPMKRKAQFPPASGSSSKKITKKSSKRPDQDPRFQDILNSLYEAESKEGGLVSVYYDFNSRPDPCTATCAACAGKVKEEDTVTCLFKHVVCASCVEESISNVLSCPGKVGSVSCGVDDCKAPYTLSEMRQCVKQRTMEKLTDRLYSQACNSSDSNTCSSKHIHFENLNAAFSCNELPKYWDTIDENETYRLVGIEGGSEEYSEVAGLFYQTMKFPQAEITRIQRVQNPFLYKFYQTKRTQLSRLEMDAPIQELNLFHGTTDSVVSSICEKGFDWRVCGKNGTKFGRGSYFATHAIYSHRYTENGVSSFAAMAQNKTLPFPSSVLNRMRARHHAAAMAQNSTNGVCQNGPTAAASQQKAPPTPKKPAAPNVSLNPTSSAFRFDPATKIKASMGDVGKQDLTVSLKLCPRLQKLVDDRASSPLQAQILRFHRAQRRQELRQQQSMLQLLQQKQAQPQRQQQEPQQQQQLQQKQVQPQRQQQQLQLQQQPLQQQQQQLQLQQQPPQPQQQQPQLQQQQPQQQQQAPQQPSALLPSPQKQPNPMLPAAQDGAGPPQTPITKHTVILGRVLVGRYTVGNSHMVKPPPINNREPLGRLYDSTVDQLEKPNLYVIFDSSQGYPSHVINYTLDPSCPSFSG